MRAIASVVVLVTVGLLGAGCGGGADDAVDGALPDAALDAAPVDVAVPPVDASVLDGSRVQITAILGTLSATCPALSAELGAPTPSLIIDDLDFVSGEQYVRAELSAGGQRIFDTPNAGGSSTESEVMSFEVLHYCDSAVIYKTETEILYAPPDDAGASSITDLEVTIAGEKYGVSVTRVFRPTATGPTDLETLDLLTRKLDGVVRSSQRVLAADRWRKQILHVFTPNAAGVAQIMRVLPQIPAATRADTIVLVTRTSGGGFIYCNPDPALGLECPFI